MKNPKYDLHRHMGGSISPNTVFKIMKKSGTLGELTLNDITKRMVCNGLNIGFLKFLDKFKILDEIVWPDWAVEIAIQQICEDLANEGILYSELSLSINKYVYANNWDPIDIIKFIKDLFDHYTSMYKIKVGLLLSLRYDSPTEHQIKYSKLINNSEIASIFIGIDLVGNENYFDAGFYEPIFKQWKENNKILRAHVGEMPGKADNVKLAIEKLNVNRIAHGIYADEQTLKIAADKQICFDLALSSNMITGAYSDIKSHPIRKMIDTGCKITINTDDPVQFRTSLYDEFQLALSHDLITIAEANNIQKYRDDKI